MSDQSLPSPEWQNSMKKRVKEDNPSYSDDQVSKTVGDIFYNKLSPAEREKAKSTTQTASVDKVATTMADIDDLYEIQRNIRNLVYKATNIIKKSEASIYIKENKVKLLEHSYHTWIEKIIGALDDRGYDSQFSLNDATEELERSLVDSEEMGSPEDEDMTDEENREIEENEE